MKEVNLAIVGLGYWGPNILRNAWELEGANVAAICDRDEEREAIALRFGGDLTVPEIAKLLKQPLPRIEGRVYRSLRKLRDELG